MTDIFDEIPNTDDFWVQIEGATIESHFDVSAYLNARDDWLERLKNAWHRKHVKAYAWVRSKEQYFENKKKLKTIKDGAIEAITQLEKEIAVAPHKSVSWYSLTSQLSIFKWALRLSTQSTNKEEG